LSGRTRHRGTANQAGVEVAALPRDRPKPWERRGLSRAQRVVSFIQHLTITSGPHAGRKFRLRVWQKEWIRDWYRTDAKGKRIVRSAVLSMARKNGKSTLVAAIALAHLIGPERERRGQIIVGAADRVAVHSCETPRG
jgi:phage terminase large subunit-like protein